VVADLERVATGLLGMGHSLDVITRGGEVPASCSGLLRPYRAMLPER
jgi:hypothetical protein